MTDAFRKDLERLLTQHCVERESGTPDRILAEFVCGCIDAFNKTTATITSEIKSVALVRKTKPVPPSTETWEAYREAYYAVYKVEPVRNARINGQVTNLVKCLGAEDAPKVAAWFLGHRAHWYVQGGHAIGLLLKDCEKLRTEWATGIRLHRRDADEIDRTSADSAMWARVEQRVEARKAGV